MSDYIYLNNPSTSRNDDNEDITISISSNQVDNNKEEEEPMLQKDIEEISVKKKERVYWVDLLRITACFLVILTHSSIKFLIPKPKVGSYNWKSLYFYNSLARPCVPFFVMISGMFFLNPRKIIPIKQIYSKYVLRILKAYFFWSFFYNVIERYIIYYNPNVKVDKELVISALTKIILGGGHALWYLNFVIGLYILTPIFKIITTDRIVAWYAILIFSIATQFIPTLCYFLEDIYKYKELSRIIRTYFNGLYLELAGNYATYYILGYLLDTHKFRRKIYIYLLYIVGILGTFSTIYLRFKTKNDHYVEFYSFNVFMATTGIFIFYKYALNKLITPMLHINFFKKLLLSLSECSFGMYLIHMFVLRGYTKLNIHAQTFNPIYWTPIFTTIIFCTCYIIILLLRKISFFKIVT